MKTIVLTATALLLSLSVPAVFAEEPAKPKCEMCEMMKKKAAVQAARQGQAAGQAVQFAALDKLATEMNGSLGNRKIEAMAAIVTRLVEQAKASQAPATRDAAKTEAHQH